MKQIELAKQLGISKSYLSMILSGQRTARPELASKLRRYSGELVHKKTVNSKAKFCLEGSRSIQLSYRDAAIKCIIIGIAQ